MSKFVIKDLYDEHTNLSNFVYMNNKKMIFNGNSVINNRITNYETKNLYHYLSGQKNKIRIYSFNDDFGISLHNDFDSNGNFNHSIGNRYKNIVFDRSGKILFTLKNFLYSHFSYDLSKNIFEWTEEDMLYYELLSS